MCQSCSSMMEVIISLWCRSLMFLKRRKLLEMWVPWQSFAPWINRPKVLMKVLLALVWTPPIKMPSSKELRLCFLLYHCSSWYQIWNSNQLTDPRSNNCLHFDSWLAKYEVLWEKLEDRRGKWEKIFPFLFPKGCLSNPLFNPLFNVCLVRWI